ncbi:MAG: 3-dehydroquinate synthase [Lacisediminihabitans sp.]
MSEFTIRSSFGDYTISIALNAADRADDAAVALVDPMVRGRIALSSARVIEVEGSEGSKTLSECEKVLVEMKNAGLVRGDLVAAVGGGVVQDVATLTSSLYMRGVDWMYVPTTLMAMADSCIGGKSSINAGGVKNLVGNFHPPVRILVDPRFIPSLPTRAIASGLAEAVKICFARGRSSFEAYLELEASRTPGPDEGTVHLLHHVLDSKKWFVEIDEFDKAERQLLNFGHSFGHAWEAASGFTIQHGIGVAAGMLAALRHPDASKNDLTARLEQYCIDLLHTVRDDVAIATEQTDWELFRRSLRADKKNSQHELRLVLPAADESVSIREFALDDKQLAVANAALKQALEEVLA